MYSLGFALDTASPPTRASPEISKSSARLFADGHGVPRHYVEAYEWLSIAASRFPPENRDVAIRCASRRPARID